MVVVDKVRGDAQNHLKKFAKNRLFVLEKLEVELRLSNVAAKIIQTVQRLRHYPTPHCLRFSVCDKSCITHQHWCQRNKVNLKLFH